MLACPCTLQGSAAVARLHQESLMEEHARRAKKQKDKHAESGHLQQATCANSVQDLKIKLGFGTWL